MLKEIYKQIRRCKLVDTKKEAIELAKLTYLLLKASKKAGMSLGEYLNMLEEEHRNQCGEFGFGGDWWKGN